MKHCIYSFVLLLCCNFCTPTSDAEIKVESSEIEEATYQYQGDEVNFTDPAMIVEGEKSLIIFDRLMSLIDATPSGESIYISIYQFTYDALISRLIQASSRGVNIHVLIDGSSRSNNAETIERLSDQTSGIKVYPVYNDASSIAINHNKFVLFTKIRSQEGIIENLVFQTSQNFTEAGAYKLQDQLLLIDKELYQAFYAYWVAMKYRSSSGMRNYTFSTYQSADESIEAHFFPKRESGSYVEPDPIIELLDQIKNPSAAKIKIAMSAWSDTRTGVLIKLIQLIELGADVEIYTKTTIGNETLDSLLKIKNSNATIRIYNPNTNYDNKINLHTKIMIVDAKFEGGESEIILTGSQNFTNNALKNNNEVTIILHNHVLYESYQQFFETLSELPPYYTN